MIYKDRKCFVVVGNTTREPTEQEGRAIVAFLAQAELLPLGVGPVPGVGEVWFQRLRLEPPPLDVTATPC